MTCSTTFPKRSYSKESCGQISQLCGQKWKASWRYVSPEKSWGYSIQVYTFIYFCLEHSCCLASVWCLDTYWFHRVLFKHTSEWWFALAFASMPLMFYTVHRFLFDKTCAHYKYYEYRLAQEEKALSLQSKETRKSRNGWCYPAWMFFFSELNGIPLS